MPHLLPFPRRLPGTSGLTHRGVNTVIQVLELRSNGSGESSKVPFGKLPSHLPSNRPLTAAGIAALCSLSGFFRPALVPVTPHKPPPVIMRILHNMDLYPSAWYRTHHETVSQYSTFCVRNFGHSCCAGKEHTVWERRIFEDGNEVIAGFIFSSSWQQSVPLQEPWLGTI
jgi:hypothetical protein